MGCHTWCAYKVDRSIEEARKLWINRQHYLISEWKKILDNPKHIFRKDGNWSLETIEHDIKVFERQLRIVEKGLCNVAVMKKQPELSYYREGKGFFIVSEEYGDQFRIGDYPDDELYSKEECMQFIEKNKDNILFFDTTYDSLNEFWDKYPDGCIHFG